MIEKDVVRILLGEQDEEVFTVYYICAEQFKRHFHTLENYARREKFKEVKHKLESGEVLRETRLDAVSS
jgi:hypothetical protein